MCYTYHQQYNKYIAFSGHSPQQLPGLFRLVDITCVQRPDMISCGTQSLVELKLDDEAYKVAEKKYVF